MGYRVRQSLFKMPQENKPGTEGHTSVILALGVQGQFWLYKEVPAPYQWGEKMKEKKKIKKCPLFKTTQRRLNWMQARVTSPNGQRGMSNSDGCPGLVPRHLPPSPPWVLQLTGGSRCVGRDTTAWHNANEVMNMQKLIVWPCPHPHLLRPGPLGCRQLRLFMGRKGRPPPLLYL